MLSKDTVIIIYDLIIIEIYLIRLVSFIVKSEKFISARIPSDPHDQHDSAHSAVSAYVQPFPPVQQLFNAFRQFSNIKNRSP